MLFPEAFLLEECDNVELSLKETLRHEYRIRSTEDFYSECVYRLKSIRQRVEHANKEDIDEYAQYLIDISDLSALITRIERSHLGEFSHPFAAELEKLGYATCQGVTGCDSDFGQPIFAISADGGLDSYRIHHEQEAISLTINRRIFNIVFPRSLKYHVLLHPILGHELGHAAMTVPNMEFAISNNVLDELVQDSILANDTSLEKWMLDASDQYDDIDISAIYNTEDTVRSWREEFLCDLFGLLMFGPCFLPAHKSLLCANDPGCIEIGDEHPPNVSRFDLLDKAVNVLGWKDCSISLDKDIKAAVNDFWSSLDEYPSKKPDWSSFFTEDAVKKAVINLKEILDALPPASFDCSMLENLNSQVRSISNSIPPNGSSLNNNEVVLNNIDFRSILYSGWIVYAGKNKLDYYDANRLSFLNINKLCNQAILQQQAINTLTKN